MTSLVLHEKVSHLGHINKQRMLHIAYYWGAQLEPVDLDMISICQVL